MMRQDPVARALGLSLVLSAAGCSGGADAPVVLRADSAGVEVVTTTGGDRPLGWAFTREFALGGAEEGPESFYNVNTRTVGADETGAVYVLDPAAHRVVVFTSGGEYLRTVGERGQGPGEFSAPRSIAVHLDGTVSVFDLAKRALVRFDPEGTPLAEAPFPFSPTLAAGRHIDALPTGVLVSTLTPPVVENTFRNVLQLVSDGETRVLTENVYPRPEMAMYPSCGGGLNLPRIFEVDLVWDTNGEAVVLTRSPDYELEVHDGAGLRRVVRRDLPRRTATEALALAELGEGFRIDFGRGPCTIPSREMLERRGFAEAVPWIAQVAVSPAGEIWVRRKEVGQDVPGAIDLFDPTGEYLGSLPPETPFPALFLGDTRIGASEADDFDVRRLVVYTIERSPG